MRAFAFARLLLCRDGSAAIVWRVAETMQVLHYEYVPDILERREPFRDAHLGGIQEWNQRGRLVLAGAVGDPPRGAMLIFRDTAIDDIEAYANDDPYMTAGLISRWWIEPCTVVTPPPHDI